MGSKYYTTALLEMQFKGIQRQNQCAVKPTLYAAICCEYNIYTLPDK